ncbi:DUF1853 family protein [Endozoicomonas sp. YOMI1]|uniref:DUF1853 family protein n=1 Tax=Endozoicomonas sp. YOMI1 TaxID=2828739 RepID=UPI00214992D7|nr:DUF1853 family protein [Endozoicomonas sp. YOMI1]
MNRFLHQSINQTLQQAVEWVQNSPPLFNRSASPLFLDSPLPAGIAPVIPDQQQLALLASLVNKRSNPLLGIFNETLWQFLLSQLPDSQTIAYNLQVNGEKHGQPATLGEYDLIYQLKNQFIHRELAVKFYLGMPGEADNAMGSPWRHWVGPGLRDRLDRKMDHLLHHQALLSDTHEGQRALLTLGIVLPVVKEILIQGRLFYPLCTDEPAITQLSDIKPMTQSETKQNAVLCPPPEYCNPNHLQGYWLTQSHFHLSTRSITRNIRFQIPQKVQWLNQNPVAELLDHDAALRQLQPQKRPVYIRAIHQGLQTPLHLFIVPDDWPEKAMKVSKELFIQDQV